MQTNIHTYGQAYIHTGRQAESGRHTYIHTYTHKYIHAYISTYIYTYIHTYIHHTGRQAYTQISLRQTCEHTNIQTYTYAPTLSVECLGARKETK